MTEFVVPRSIPTALAMFDPPRSRANGSVGVEAGCLEDGLESEELDQLVHAGSAFAFADALTDFGEECRWVDGAVGERGDCRFDDTPVRVVQAVQQLGDAPAMLRDREDHRRDHPVLGDRDIFGHALTVARPARPSIPGSRGRAPRPNYASAWCPHGPRWARSPDHVQGRPATTLGTTGRHGSVGSCSI